MATFVERDGEPVAALVHDAALAYEPELLEIVCATADVALEQERLHAKSRAHAEELIGSRARIVEAGDLARKRIERDLHDGAQQRLVALMIALRLAEGRIQDDPAAAGKLVASAREELAQSLAELRELAHGIHPAMLAYGLGPALTSLAARAPLPVTLSLDAEDRLEIADDGIGGADAANGSGLRGLADRVAAVGGRLHVESPVGGGTVLTAELPCTVRSPATPAAP